MPIRVLIADDHQLFVDGIRMLLQEDPDIEIKGWCLSGQDVLLSVQQDAVDIVLLDINLPNKNGVSVCQELVQAFPEVKVIALTTHQEGSFISQMLKYGAKGYVLKNVGLKELQEAIKKVYAGETYFSQAVTRQLMESMMPTQKRTEQTTLPPKLTRREKEVLQLIAREHTTQEIADQLFVSLHTIETHRKNLLQKLGARNIAGLVRYAVEKGLID